MNNGGPVCSEVLKSLQRLADSWLAPSFKSLGPIPSGPMPLMCQVVINIFLHRKLELSTPPVFFRQQKIITREQSLPVI